MTDGCRSMTTDDYFVAKWNALAKDCRDIAIDHGWTTENEGEKIALMHSELSECLEYLRHNNPPSDHIPDFSGAEEELADVVIRIMHFAIAQGYDVPRALLAKMEFNRNRPYKHGGKKW